MAPKDPLIGTLKGKNPSLILNANVLLLERNTPFEIPLLRVVLCLTDLQNKQIGVFFSPLYAHKICQSISPLYAASSVTMSTCELAMIARFINDVVNEIKTRGHLQPRTRSTPTDDVSVPLAVCVLNLQSDGDTASDTNPHLASCCELLELVLRKGLQRKSPTRY